VALASSAVGAYLHVVWNIGGMLTMVGCVGSIAWLFSVPVYEEVRSPLLRQLTLASCAGSRARNLTPENVNRLLTFFLVVLPCLSVRACVQRKRYGLLMAAALLEGASVGPLIKLAVEFDPR